MTTCSPIDVAELVMQSHAQKPTAKEVQKLAFYAHVIHRALHKEPLIQGGFQAWRDGPVSPAIYARQKGHFRPLTVHGDPSQVPDDCRESVRLAIELYGDRTESALIALSHGDGPWTLARGEVPPNSPSREPIPDETIDMVLVPTVRQLLDAHGGRRLTLEEFKAEFVS